MTLSLLLLLLLLLLYCYYHHYYYCSCYFYYSYPFIIIVIVVDNFGITIDTPLFPTDRRRCKRCNGPAASIRLGPRTRGLCTTARWANWLSIGTLLGTFWDGGFPGCQKVQLTVYNCVYMHCLYMFIIIILLYIYIYNYYIWLYAFETVSIYLSIYLSIYIYIYIMQESKRLSIIHITTTL